MSRHIFSAAILLLVGSMAVAKTADNDVVMTIGEETVSRAEFVCCYNTYRQDWAKSVRTGRVARNTPLLTVREYQKVLADYKLKVRAAKDAQLDTLKSFRDRMAAIMGHQPMSPYVVTGQVEKEALQRYQEYKKEMERTGGVALTRQILVALPQQATTAFQHKAEQRADSIYKALQAGADFARLARQCSDDKRSASQGGLMPWIQRDQTVKAYADVAFTAKTGTVSRPILSEFGYHIIKVEDRQKYLSYDSLRVELCRSVESRRIRESVTQIDPQTLAQMKPVRNIAPTRMSFQEALHGAEHDGGKKCRLLHAYEQMLVADIEDSVLHKAGGKPADAAPAKTAKAEKKWLKALKKKYKVAVNKKVLATLYK